MSNPPIEFDLALSTGPVWTLRELLALDGDATLESLLDLRVSYISAAGTPELRTAIAKLSGVEMEHVQVVTGAEEALLILFFVSARQGANIVLPSPGFPANAALAQSLGIKTRFYRLRAENGFAIDADEIRTLVDHHTQLVLVNTPHNPTGYVPLKSWKRCAISVSNAACSSFQTRFIIRSTTDQPRSRLRGCRMPQCSAISRRRCA